MALERFGRGGASALSARLGFAVVLMLAFVGGAWFADAAEDTSPAVGLRGILPSLVPADVAAALEALPENWGEWGVATAAELAALYEQPDLDVAGQRQAIAALRKRVATISNLLGDARYKGMQGQLITLRGALKKRLDLADAVLDTLELGPEIKAQRVSAARTQLASTANALENYLGIVPNGTGWKDYLRVGDVRALAQKNDDQIVTALGEVQSRLDGSSGHDDSQVRAFVSRTQLAAYHRAVGEYLSVAGMALVANSPELRSALAELVKAIEDYEASRSSATSAAARAAYDKVRKVAPDGGERITKAMRDSYLNYNVRLVASEQFLNRFVRENRTETSGICEFAFEALVSGAQTTVTHVGLDLTPSNNGARFYVTVNGAVAASTTAEAEKATIYTHGNHYFWAWKPVLFDGEKFSTSHAMVSVSANNTVTGAETKYEGVPILSGIARRIAIKTAEKQMPESESYAAQKIRDRVVPEVNREVDKEFGPGGSINPEVSERLNALRDSSMYPDVSSWSTTDTELHMSARLMAGSELGANVPHPLLVLGRGATLMIHESAMNNAVDRVNFAGQTLTDEQFKQKIQDQVKKILGREIDLSKGEQPKAAATEEEAGRTLMFDTHDPIRFQVADGVILVTIRAGLKQEGKEDIPTQVVTLPLKLSVDQANVIVEPGNVSVEPAERPDNAAAQISRAGVIKKKIEDAFPRREIDRVLKIERGSKSVSMAVTRFRALDGWLSITVE
jgi:hypothetical protein